MSRAELPFLVLLNCSTARFDLGPHPNSKNHSLWLCPPTLLVKDLHGKPATLHTLGLKSSLKWHHGITSQVTSVCACVFVGGYPVWICYDGETVIAGAPPGLTRTYMLISTGPSLSLSQPQVLTVTHSSGSMLDPKTATYVPMIAAGRLRILDWLKGRLRNTTPKHRSSMRMEQEPP